jgi:3-oxoacyl-[acyl-carrier protein] reductase
MISIKSGKIINIASMWGEVGASMEVHYSASKAGLIGLTKALAKEVGLSGITVNAVSPGVIETDMMSQFSAEDKKILAEETPLGVIGDVQSVANAVSFIVSDKADFITGQVISVNGGFVI